MMLRGLGLVFCALSAMSAPTAATEYVIDTKGGHASINFRVQHLGFSWLTGRFDTFSGAFRYDEKNPSASGISVTIDTTSVNSNHAERDKHLRGADFLDVAQLPSGDVRQQVGDSGRQRQSCHRGRFHTARDHETCCDHRLIHRRWSGSMGRL